VWKPLVYKVTEAVLFKHPVCHLQQSLVLNMQLLTAVKSHDLVFAYREIVLVFLRQLNAQLCYSVHHFALSSPAHFVFWKLFELLF
jgi:hypothetical protein